MDINFNSIGWKEEILDASGFSGSLRKSLRKEIIRCREDIAAIIAVCAEQGLTVVDATPIEADAVINEIKNQFADLLLAGVETLPGIFMKCDFDDALIVRESALFKQAAGETTMTLKDINGDLHPGIDLQDVLDTVVPLMAQRYSYLWETKEGMIATLKSAGSQQEVDDFVITW